MFPVSSPFSSKRIVPFLWVSLLIGPLFRGIAGQEPVLQPPDLSERVADAIGSVLEVSTWQEAVPGYLSNKAFDILLGASFSWTLSVLAALGKQEQLSPAGYGGRVSTTKNSPIGTIAEYMSNPWITQTILHEIKSVLHGADYRMTLREALEYFIGAMLEVVADVAVGTCSDAIIPSIDIPSLAILKEHLEWRLLNPSQFSMGRASFPLIKAVIASFLRQLPKVMFIELVNDIIGALKDRVVDGAKDKVDAVLDSTIEPDIEAA